MWHFSLLEGERLRQKVRFESYEEATDRTLCFTTPDASKRRQRQPFLPETACYIPHKYTKNSKKANNYEL